MPTACGFTVAGDPGDGGQRSIVLGVEAMLTVLILLGDGFESGSTDEVDEAAGGIALK